MVNMDIETAFSVLMGILMVIAVTVAAVVIMISASKGSIHVRECIPSDYVTSNTAGSGQPCGFIDMGGTPTRVYCDNRGDTCMDPGNNKCCPTSLSGIAIYGGRCCRTEVI